MSVGVRVVVVVVSCNLENVPELDDALGTGLLACVEGDCGIRCLMISFARNTTFDGCTEVDDCSEADVSVLITVERVPIEADVVDSDDPVVPVSETLLLLATTVFVF